MRSGKRPSTQGARELDAHDTSDAEQRGRDREIS
jgi:hypothetical protein